MKVTLTQQEICEKFGFHEGTEIVISYEVHDERWISNVGRDVDGHPDSLEHYDEINIMYRNGVIDKGHASDWYCGWKETDNTVCDIVAYRIIK